MLRSLVSLTLLSLVAMPAAAQNATPDSAAALAHARKLLHSTLLWDGHNDLPWEIRTSRAHPRDVAAYDLRQHTSGMTDLPRLAEGGLNAQFWSIYIPGEIKDSGFARVQLEQFDIARRMIERYPDKLELALTSDDVMKAYHDGKIASLLGMEGGQAIENSLGALRSYYRLGARYMTLTHNVTLDWADAALDTAAHGGLTPFGREVVREMNRLGMLVDLAHVSPGTMSDALDVSEAPVMFSHSSARAITDVPRNVPDSILARLRKNGGIVMITFVPDFVSQARADSTAKWTAEFKASSAGVTDPAELRRMRREFWSTRRDRLPQATIKDVADHVEHARDVAGIDHIGLGGDFDGITDTVVGLDDVSKYPYLFAELIRRGWSDADLKKLAGENMLRVMREMEAVAHRLQQTRAPSTATIGQLDHAEPTS
ncbi:MAG TPA: dipeptidase [Gemmatimonadales bacterium]|nr:dipeptidase [Gemmatimonadales bacterium]